MSAGHSPSEGDVIDLGFGGLSAAAGDHISHSYRTQNEITHLLVPYFAASLRAGDKCALVCKPVIREMVLEGLRAQGMPVEKALASGQLVLHEGVSSAQAAMDCFSELILRNEEGGVPPLPKRRGHDLGAGELAFNR